MDSDADMYGIPALGWTAPVSDGSSVYFGGGMYGTSGMGVDFAPTRFSVGAGGAPGGGDDVIFDGYSSIAFWQMAPTLAWNVNDRFSVGVSLNMDYQSVAFKQRFLVDTDNDGFGDADATVFDLSKKADAFGYGASIGLMYSVSDRLTLGASYKSKQFFEDLEYNLSVGDLTANGNPLPGGKYSLDLDYPQQAALGIAYRFGQGFTVAADVKWIDWSSTMNKLAVEGPGGASFPLDPGWEDQWVYAVGIDWALTDAFNLRAGYNYAKSPIDSEDVGSNLILPAVVESHFTAGLGYKFNNRWSIDLHAMYVPEQSFTAPVVAAPTDPNKGQTISLSEYSFGINIGYRF